MTGGRGHGGTTAASPELSAILVTDSLEAVRKTLAYLRAQTGSEKLEMVIVAPREARLRADLPELEAFGQAQIVEVEDVSRPPLVRAKAIQAARAPLVLFAETHAYPRPGYIDALLRAHDAGPWAAVGASMGNANPDSVVSWANLFVDYGPWVESPRRGVAEDVPGHNAAYKREALLEFGDELPELLRADSLMHGELRARGYELYMESEAKIDHLNVSRLGWSIVERFHSSRNFAGLRSRNWGWAHRAAYVAGAPLIPVVRLTRIVANVRGAGRASLLPRLLLPLLLVLSIGALGELVGYAFGPGRSRLLYDLEVHRARYVRPSDRRRDADQRTWPS